MDVLFYAAADGKAVSATDAALAAVALPVSDGNSLRIVNEGPNVVFIAVGNSTVSATLPGSTQAKTCTPVLAGEDITLRIDPAKDKYISTICRSGGTAVLTVQVGVGA